MSNKRRIFCNFAVFFVNLNPCEVLNRGFKGYLYIYIKGMTDRTFHKRFSVPAKCGVAVFALLTGYFFWVKVAIIGILLAIVIVGMIERILNTTYTFRRVQPIDRDEEMDFIVINEGRFSRNQTIPVCDIVSVEPMNTCWGLDHALVIQVGANKLVSLQPDNEEIFIREIEKRIKNEE